ncbi:MAG TPA: hypothetical protein VF809_00680 [Candidatus Saccharimonadales bacterium]
MIIVAVLVILAAGVILHEHRGVKTYSDKNISFQYPSSWKTDICKNSRLSFTIPGTIRGNYKTDDYPLIIEGGLQGYCEGDNLHINEMLSEKSSDKKCNSYNKGEELRNGLFIDMPRSLDSNEYVSSIFIELNACYAKGDTILFAFDFDDPHSNVGGEQILKYGGEPSIKRLKFLASWQYKEIRKFAESIELK